MKILATALFLASVTLVAPPLQAQQTTKPLPPAAKEFLESDQLARWTRMVQFGDSLFNNGSCMRCHGASGKGTPRAPDLSDSSWVQSDGSFDGIFESIFWGVRRKDFHDKTRRFEMNPGGGMNLPWNDLRAITAYVWTLNNGNFLPERR